ncbi:GerMN domain-containing protein [Alkaliphilus serpentinus]|uniref:GerMN domain-containing protein n=1 Tax=Alkaliphilus serpentinus TaxID=1482731 RepID=A0A833HN87_9FIRM|nr:GerMN domain-containing protein [Alkaliphilus serpentinus]KAB3529213.1 GerMN domain-containing protein [Alkaliphilus serpentinus]
MKKWISLSVGVLMIFSLAACSNKVQADDNDQQDNQQEVPIGENVNPPETEEEAEELVYVLYLKQKNLPYIFPDSFSIMEDDYRLADTTFEEFVMKELINQEDFDELMNPIPPGTRVLSVTMDDNTAIVDLSEEFETGMIGTKKDVEATVAIIVNTLTTLEGIDKVQILVEGEALTDLKGVDLSKPFEFITDFYMEK